VRNTAKSPFINANFIDIKFFPIRWPVAQRLFSLNIDDGSKSEIMSVHHAIPDDVRQENLYI